MATTDIAVIDKGGYLALNHDTEEVIEIVEENLGGQLLSARDLLRVKMPSGGSTTWEVPGPAGPQPTKDLQGILIHFKFVRGYWVPGATKGVPPSCSAEGPEQLAVGIGTPGGACKTCPFNVFGSEVKDNGKPGRGKACKERELWFLLQPSMLLPIALSLSPMSLKAAREYRTGTLGSSGIRTHSVVTSITLKANSNPDGDDYAQIVPTMVGALDPEEAAATKEYAARLKPMLDAVATTIAAEGDPVDADVVDTTGEDVPPGEAM